MGIEKTREVVGRDIFMIDDENLLCIVDYYIKFPVVKKLESMSAQDLIQVTKVVFAEFGLPKNIFSDAGTNYFSEQSKDFCKCLNIDQVMTLLYHHQINVQMEAFIKSVKCTIKKCRQANNEVRFALLQIRSTLIGAGLPSPTMMLFNRWNCQSQYTFIIMMSTVRP